MNNKRMSVPSKTGPSDNDRVNILYKLMVFGANDEWLEWGSLRTLSGQLRWYCNKQLFTPVFPGGSRH